MSTIAAHSRSQSLERILDVAAVLFLSLAAVATAWCGYQASLWNSDRALHYSLAEGARIEASTAASLANTQRTVDVNLFLEYENAVYSGRNAFAAHLRNRFRPEFKAASDAWLAMHPRTNAHAPSSPFVMAQYRLKSDADARRAATKADSLTNAAIMEDAHSDQYVLATVILAIVSFLGGISSKARYPMSAVLLIGAGALLLLQLLALAKYPIH